MSRVSVLESLYSRKRSALEFNYDSLCAPPIRALLTQEDINQLINIATSLRYNGKIEKKYKLIDEVMNRRGFRKAHSGTNRVVYNFLEDTRFVAKIAIDRVGMKDTPAEYKNQEFFKPFCCKIFEVDSSGVIGFVERVNPITSLEEFLSVSDDIFNMIITKIVGKYVVDDIGTTKYMNFGNRMGGFGPVIIDFPYAFELDGNKLQCNREIITPQGKIKCGGEIDYDPGFNYLICTKCGKTYQARDLANKTKDIIVIDDEGRLNLMNKVRIVAPDGTIEIDDYSSSKTYVTKDEYRAHVAKQPEFQPIVKVGKEIYRKRKPKYKRSPQYYSNLMLEKFAENEELTYKPFEQLGPTKQVRVGGIVTNIDEHEEVKPVNICDNVEYVRVGKPEPKEEVKEVEDTVIPEEEVVNTEEAQDYELECETEEYKEAERKKQQEVLTNYMNDINEAMNNGASLEDLYGIIDSYIEDFNIYNIYCDIDDFRETVKELYEAKKEDPDISMSMEFDESNEQSETVEETTEDVEVVTGEVVEAEESVELNLFADFTIGMNAYDEEPDYSNYTPDEESEVEEDEEPDENIKDYNEYVESYKKKDKRKQHYKVNNEEMEDY